MGYEVGEQRFLLGGKGRPALEEVILLICQFHEAALRKKLREGNAEAFADIFKRRNAGLVVAVEYVGDGGLRDAALLGQPVFRPAPLVYHPSNTLLGIN